MWSALVTAITGFITSIFSMISAAFTGVVSIFWVSGSGENAGPTVLLEALAFAAAAAIAGVAIYAIVRLIKGAVARTRSATGSVK